MFLFFAKQRAWAKPFHKPGNDLPIEWGVSDNRWCVWGSFQLLPPTKVQPLCQQTISFRLMELQFPLSSLGWSGGVVGDETGWDRISCPADVWEPSVRAADPEVEVESRGPSPTVGWEMGSLTVMLSLKNRRNQTPLSLHEKVLPDKFPLRQGLILGQNSTHKRESDLSWGKWSDRNSPARSMEPHLWLVPEANAFPSVLFPFPSSSVHSINLIPVTFLLPQYPLPHPFKEGTCGF